MDLFQIKKEFNDSNILICFNGPFSHSILEEIGIAIRNHLDNENVTKAAISDVFSIYIELTQNARNYIIERQLPPGELSSTIVVVARKDETHAVTSGNYILKDDVQPLKERIEQINAMNADDLKALYKKQLRSERPEGARGAGIGLIDIARKTSSNMEYNIRPVDDRYDFFSLTAFI
ncbi:SiaB family protein kinase [Leptonema illini]|uniref:SiaB family protein kinase n=1 Tax=Leptonema illini TaxID=183 RepID=UPI000990DBA1|nr:SiaB family protein kinase [Leptonema illini]